MRNSIYRSTEYIDALKEFIAANYHINAAAFSPAKRGYYGETWRLDTAHNSYFIKLDYSPRHQELYKNSLPVIEYLCSNKIDFAGSIIKTYDGMLYSIFDSAVLGVFRWIDGENIETDETKAPEYQMLCKIYPLTKRGLPIPTMEFSDSMAIRFYEMLEKLKTASLTEPNAAVLSLLERKQNRFSQCAFRLSHFASICQNNREPFFITHGDAGGNFFVSNHKNYIIDWDEVMYAPPERDAWVMGCHDWARKLFNQTLRENNINYELNPARLAFYCYHMFFLYLGEFLEDFMSYNTSDGIENYLNGSWIEERIQFADSI